MGDYSTDDFLGRSREMKKKYCRKCIHRSPIVAYMQPDLCGHSSCKGKKCTEINPANKCELYEEITGEKYES